MFTVQLIRAICAGMFDQSKHAYLRPTLQGLDIDTATRIRQCGLPEDYVLRCAPHGRDAARDIALILGDDRSHDVMIVTLGIGRADRVTVADVLEDFHVDLLARMTFMAVAHRDAAGEQWLHMLVSLATPTHTDTA